MLLERMRVVSARPEPVERGYAHGARKVGVRAPCRVLMRDLESEPLRDRAGLSIEGPIPVARRPKGTCDGWLNDKTDVRIRRFKRQDPLPGAVELRLALLRDRNYPSLV